MPRPVKRRRVCALPAKNLANHTIYTQEDALILGVDEYEVIRLIDLLGLTQEECAVQMDVARTTVQALYDRARRKTAEAIVQGKRILIGGGSYTICPNSQRCCGKDCSGTRWKGGGCLQTEFCCRQCRK